MTIPDFSAALHGLHLILKYWIHLSDKAAATAAAWLIAESASLSVESEVAATTLSGLAAVVGGAGGR